MQQGAPAVRGHDPCRDALQSAHLIGCPGGFEKAESRDAEDISLHSRQGGAGLQDGFVSAASVLASIPSLELIAREHVEVYRAIRSLREKGFVVTAIWVKIRLQHRQRTLDAWREELTVLSLQGQRRRSHPTPARLVGTWKKLSFQMIQVLRGHGCFGHHLC